jgi:hypothetical protein
VKSSFPLRPIRFSCLLLLAWAVGCALSHNPDLPSGDSSGDGDGDINLGTGGTAGDGDAGGAPEDTTTSLAGGGGAP